MPRGLSFTAKHIASQLPWQAQSYNSYFHHLHVKCIYEIFDKRVIDAYLLAYDIYTLLRLFCIFKRHKIYILCCEYGRRCKRIDNEVCVLRQTIDFWTFDRRRYKLCAAAQQRAFDTAWHSWELNFVRRRILRFNLHLATLQPTSCVSYIVFANEK